jgi:GT2 family glycosyltransferase
MTTVAVSIVNASNRDLLLRCLDTLADDPGRRCGVEVVVLDNASDDGSAAAVAERHPELRVIEQPVRDGLGANNNAVVRETASEYVFLLNPDTEVRPGTIDALVDHLAAHPEAAAAGPRIVGPDGAQQHSAWRLMTPRVQLTWALTLGQYGAVVSRGDEPKAVGAVSACAMMVRRAAFEAAGMFDEAYFMFSEEADLAERLRRAGLETHYVPSVELLHHGQQSTGSAPERQINETWRSLELYLDRWHGPLAARTMRWLTGLGYGLAAIVAEIGRRLPRRLRPAAAAAWNPHIYRLHVRNAFRGVRGPGIREAALAWNARHAPSAAEAPHQGSAGR